ncbi:CoA transferase, partial [Novosphingobium sp.]|uniref:CoA transferase n=1 Tax=Novosphingobium sp. TaxID=1874826 RepID=UPI002629AC66
LRSRTENISEVLASVARELATRSTAEWMDLFRRAEIPATPIASMEQLLHDPHLVETGFWQERETDAGTLRYPGIPTTFSETPGAIGDPGPVLGADNMAVLDEAGFSPEEVSALVASGAVIS